MKDQELVRRDRQLGVRLALIVGEFDFGRAVQKLHDGAHLATHEAVGGHVREKSDDSSRRGVVCIAVALHFAKQLVSRGAVPARRTI
jgi:hypothetical protein